MVPTIFGSQQLHYLQVIKQMLVQALSSPTKEVIVDRQTAGCYGDNVTGVDGSCQGNRGICDAG